MGWHLQQWSRLFWGRGHFSTPWALRKQYWRNSWTYICRSSDIFLVTVSSLRQCCSTGSWRSHNAPYHRPHRWLHPKGKTALGTAKNSVTLPLKSITDVLVKQHNALDVKYAHENWVQLLLDNQIMHCFSMYIYKLWWERVNFTRVWSFLECTDTCSDHQQFLLIQRLWINAFLRFHSDKDSHMDS